MIGSDTPGKIGRCSSGIRAGDDEFEGEPLKTCI